MPSPGDPLDGLAPPPHALVMGGTGMLRDVTLELAQRGMNVSVMARNVHRTRELCAGNPQRLHPICVDWHETEWLDRRTREAVAERGAVQLVVCWCHTTAPDAPMTLARRAAESIAPGSCRFLHVLGSSSPATNPVKARWRDAISSIPAIEYQMVQLGCERLGRVLRWLSHDVIAEGVLSALDSRRDYTLIGEPIP